MMRWVTFLLFAVILLTLQSAAAPRLELFGARPDWLLVTVVFFALYASPREALICAWIIGGCADLMTVERLGLLALSYGMAAAAVAAIREFLFCHRAATQYIITFMACLLITLAWTAYRRALYDPAGSMIVDLAMNVLVASLYTAAWAPPLHMALLRIPRAFGLPRTRYTHAGLRALGNSHV